VSFYPKKTSRPKPLTVVLTMAYAAAFGSDPKMIGRKLSLSGDSYTIVGVMRKTSRLATSDADVGGMVEPELLLPFP